MEGGVKGRRMEAVIEEEDEESEDNELGGDEGQGWRTLTRTKMEMPMEIMKKSVTMARWNPDGFKIGGEFARTFSSHFCVRFMWNTTCWTRQGAFVLVEQVMMNRREEVVMMLLCGTNLLGISSEEEEEEGGGKEVIETMQERFMRLYKRKAMIHHYNKFLGADAQQEFDDAAENLKSLVQEYEEYDMTGSEALPMEKMRIKVAT
eukprot:762646-Hanusia_phi.AAC.2